MKPALVHLVLVLVLVLSIPALADDLSAIAAADWPMYGHDIAQSRFNPGETTITAANVAGLSEAWFLTTSAPVSATPAVVNGVVYIGSWDHNFYALNAQTGAVLWKVTVATPQGDSKFPGIQSSAAVAHGRVYFGDSCGYLHAYAADGSGATPSTMTMRNRGCGSTGTESRGFPIDIGGSLPNSADAINTDIFSSPIPFTPTAGANEDRPMIYIGAASHQDSPCIHGALFAIDARSGKIVWRFDTVPQSAIGGAVWSTPSIDAINNLVYIDTGDCVNNSSSGLSESIVALDASCAGVAVDDSCKDLPPVTYPPNALTPGNPIWAFQAHPNGDIADFDFGSSPNIITDATGAPALVGAGSKDGSYYAVKAGRAGGQLAWTTRVANVSSVSVGTSVGTAAGGFQGSTGFAYGKVFGTTVSGPEFEVALDGMSGALTWDAADALSSFSPVGVANGIVFAGDNTGNLKARDAASGMMLSTFMTGGSISSGPVPAEGMLFVGVGGTLNDSVETRGVLALKP